MKIEKISIKNYRCYENEEISFGTESTIIIGKNGTGKSTLLSAIRKGMTFMFSGTSNNKFKKNNDTKIEGFANWDTRYVEDGSGFQYPTVLNYKVLLDKSNIHWNFYKEGIQGKLHSTYYKDALGIINKLNNKGQFSWPVLAFYGDCYPHKRRENNKRIKDFNDLLLTEGILPRDIGYSFWNEDTSIVSSWFNRYKYIVNLIKQEEDLLQHLDVEINFLEEQRKLNKETADTQSFNNIVSKRNNFNLLFEKYNNKTIKLVEERDFVKETVLSFFKKDNESIENELVLHDISVRATTGGDLLFFNLGSSSSFSDGVYNEETLPMGYMRLIHIVFDLAYRCYIINGKDDEAKGIALIDELELHLHPSLQKVILNKFKRTFKGIQFIATTHSPIILSKIQTNETNKVLKLDKIDKKYYSKELRDVYSTDFNYNLINVMNVDLSNQLLDTYINAYQFLKNDDKKLANQYYEKIKELFNGKIPDFVQIKLS
ncbi:AAA family ATPase [Myroides odoratimimus]|uniref:AAA family ATPase n=1 Tax=Myroides odoratimimus TaxID=76832 RepID=UPI002576927F|nr:AAA family ATPase [Myroides odoratimimus]MDM1413273.1 AAA family ATPase [Myroides odoratimimus]MEC4005998.1 AAA family ATPase [Myroides odoratimimus]